jgi:hypothetical protein
MFHLTPYFERIGSDTSQARRKAVLQTVLRSQSVFLLTMNDERDHQQHDLTADNDDPLIVTCARGRERLFIFSVDSSSLRSIDRSTFG